MLHLDVRACFYSVDLSVLRGLLAHRIRDRAFLAVLDRVLDSGAGLLDGLGRRAWLGFSADWPPPGRGLPLGAQTSQFLVTHVVFNGLDHHIKRALKVPGYVRYVDDLFLFVDGRKTLERWRGAIGAWLAAERNQRLKHPRAPVLSCRGTLHALGQRARREGIRPGSAP